MDGHEVKVQKGAIPAVMLLALAYSVNGLSSQMGTANYIISLTENFLTPHMLPAIIFLVSAIMAFTTGSSWGTFAICMPIALVCGTLALVAYLVVGFAFV